MTKKAIASAASVAALAFALTACGPAAAPDSSGAPGDGQRTKITWLQWWGNEKGMDTLNKIKAAFEDAHPDIELEIQDVPAAQALDKITTLSLGGQAPDVIAMQAAWQTEFATSSIISPLDDFIQAEGPEFRAGIEGPLVSPYKGKTWSIPLNYSPVAMYYNKAILSEAGVEVPATWEEFRTVAEQISAKTGKFAVTANLAVEPPTPISYEIFPFIIGAGGHILDEDNRAAFSSPEGVRALEFLKELWDTKGVATPGAAGTTESQKRENFVAGNTAFMFDGPAGISIVRNGNAALDFGVAPLPVDTTEGRFVLGSMLGVTEGSKNKEAAWKFLAFIGSPEGSALWSEVMSVFPANAEAMDAPHIADDEDLAVFADIVKTSDVLESIDQRLPDANDLRKLFTNEMQAFFSGSTSAEDALSAAQDAWNAAIDADK